MQEFKVTSVEFSDEIIDIGAEAAKKLPSHCRYRYYVKTTKHVENGVVIHGTEQAMSKPKLRKKIEDTKNRVAKGQVFAKNMDGRWHTIIRFVFDLTNEGGAA